MPRTFAPAAGAQSRQPENAAASTRSIRHLGENAMKPMMKTIYLSAVCMAWLPLAGLDAALAQDYPNKPVHWIVPYTPGGGTDIAARIMGQWLSERLGQQFVIE